MKFLIAIFFCISLSYLGYYTPQNVRNPEQPVRRKILFDFDWLFHRGGAQGAQHISFDDSQWRKVDLPHDWSIEDIPGTSSPFNPTAIGQVSTGFTVGGTGWYRKKFTLSGMDTGKLISIRFEGVYMNADVWLNGMHLGNHPYGYTGFVYDISKKIQYGETNVLAVEVKNEGQNSRWYTGSGIYRHVWLEITDPVYIDNDNTFITTRVVTNDSAMIHIALTVANKSRSTSQVELISSIVDPSGNKISEMKSAGLIPCDGKVEFHQRGFIQAPQYWSVQSPDLYKLKTDVYKDGSLCDHAESVFGIRTISFDPVHGFQLNGETLLLKGGCVHHDNGPLGARAYDRAEVRRVEILKSNGFNAIRCAHNPPSPAFLNACDSLGMLVIDEAFDMWNYPKNPYDYHLYFRDWWQRDVKGMVKRDRNHPSVIMWSIGNEIVNADQPDVARLAHMLADTIRSLDPTRPVTSAVNNVSDKKDPYFSALDIAGYNYARDHYAADHNRKPDRVIFCSESYALEAFDYWSDVEKYPWVIGDFIWTSFDYLGEASIGWRGYMQKSDYYPWNLAYCGDIDICGWKRPQSYYRDAIWKNGNNVSIFIVPPEPSFPVNTEKESWSKWNWHDVVADWNWKGYEGKILDAVIYSSCEEVELKLNGKSLGRKNISRESRYTAHWDVPYQPGTLTATGYKGHAAVSTTQLATAGVIRQIRLTPDRFSIRADGEDLSYVTVELVDENGIRNPKAENPVKFNIRGPGTIVAVGNANPVSLESFSESQRKAWKGRCLVIVKSERSAGAITLQATVDGLEKVEVTINVQ